MVGSSAQEVDPEVVVAAAVKVEMEVVIAAVAAVGAVGAVAVEVETENPPSDQCHIPPGCTRRPGVGWL